MFTNIWGNFIKQKKYVKYILYLDFKPRSQTNEFKQLSVGHFHIFLNKRSMEGLALNHMRKLQRK